MEKQKTHEQIVATEIGTIRKAWRDRIRVALVYPNTYHVGMSNLGFQTVYRQLNAFEHVVCERSFLPVDSQGKPVRITSLESRRPLGDFDIIAFSISFENDYPHIPAILAGAALPLQSNDRGTPHPLVVAGGVACFINPEAIAAFIDCFLIGEAEVLLPRFIEQFDAKQDRCSFLKHLARNVPGTYVPSLYRSTYHPDGTLASFEALCDVPQKIERVFCRNLSKVDTCSTILTPDTTFGQTALIEVGRGCPHGCRFCSAGFVYRPPRFKSTGEIENLIDRQAAETDRIGLVGAAVSDLPGIERLCGRTHLKGTRISFSSLRADALTPELISTLRHSRVKTATIAPDAGSQRMRNVINKGIEEEEILHAAESLVVGGIPNLKLYFMIGLPTETDDDIDAIITLCKKIKHRFLKSSRTRKQIGTITVSLNAFIPKPVTPFQWVAMAEIPQLKQKIKQVKRGLNRIANIRLHSDIPRWAYLQGLFSRGDRRVASILLLSLKNEGNWAKTLKESPLNSDFYNYRERAFDEILPWQFINHGIKTSFLREEYRRALQGKKTTPCRMVPCEKCRICMETNL